MRITRMAADYSMLAGYTLVALLLLSGCTTLFGPGTPSPEELSEACTRAFVGGPFDAVLLRYGQPTGQVPYGPNITIYQFQASNTVRLHETVTSKTNGRIGTNLASIPYSERTTSDQGYNQELNCMMRVGVYPNGTVHGIDFVGLMGACKVFMP